MSSAIAAVTDLLDRAAAIVARHDEEARSAGRHFNLFDVLDRAEDEVKGHSAFITALLDPRGTHGQGPAFLRLFLDALRAEAAAQPDEVRASLDAAIAAGEWRVGVEVPFAFPGAKGGTTRGRIDLLLEAPGLDIVIENKIYAGDQDAQLDHYFRFAALRGKPLLLCYLTLDGSAPAEHSCRTLPAGRVLCLSYRGFVDRWLGGCAARAAAAPAVLASILQYRLLTRRLSGAGADSAVAMEIADLLRDDGRLAAACAVGAALAEAKARVQLGFWEALRAALAARMGLGDADFIAWKEPSRARVEAFCAGETGARYFGWVVRLATADETRSLGLFAFVHRHVYFGFTPFEGDAQVRWPAGERWAEVGRAIARAVPDSKKDLWSRWKLPRVRLNFDAFTPACVELVDPAKLGARADEIAAEMAEAVARLRDAAADLEPPLIWFVSPRPRPHA